MPLTHALLMQGPKDTPYEGGVFELIINVPEQYPLTPPSIRYKTKIFHPNIHFKVHDCAFTQPKITLAMQTGDICLDILKTAWSPAWTLLSVCQAIMALMSAPAPDSPLNCDAGGVSDC